MNKIILSQNRINPYITQQNITKHPEVKIKQTLKTQTSKKLDFIQGKSMNTKKNKKK